MTPYVTKDYEQIKKTLIQFKEQYEEALGYDIGYLNAHIKNDELGKFVNDAFLLQIYEMAGLIKPSCSIYQQMYKIICRNFELGRNIIEVGSGKFPILGDYLSRNQLKLGTGLVTVYDSQVWTKYPTEAKLKKYYFNSQIKVSKDSLLVGLFPCEATECMVDKVIRENLECCIALCGCNHSGIPYLSTNQYHQRLIDTIKSRISAEKILKIKYFSRSCFSEGADRFPILLVKEKPKIKIFSFHSKRDDKISKNMI